MPEGPNTQALSQQNQAALQDPVNPLAPAVPEQLDWQQMEQRVRQLLTDWDHEVRETKLRRAQRNLDVNVEAMRSGPDASLNADETLIPVRVIDENIKKEKPLFADYLTQSRRLAIFDNPTAPQQKKEELELAFKRGMTYSGFYKNILKVVDGAELHGWDSVETLFDATKPLHCGVEHIGHEHLIFARDSKGIQAQEFVLRALDVTVTQLKSFQKKHGFDSAMVQQLIVENEEKKAQTQKNIRIYKYFTKIDDIVWVGWCSLREDQSGGSAISDWLKKPELLDMGRRKLETITVMQEEMTMSTDLETGLPISIPIRRPVQQQQWVQVQEPQYPIDVYIYEESEEQCIVNQKGRAFFDNPSQEAQVALWSLFINGAVRASNVYASSSTPSVTGGPLSKINTTLEHGCIYSDKIDFFHVDYPDPAILRAADGLNNRKAQEMGQTASAVINRDDSRKTAEELKQARGEQMKMGTLPILNFSSFMREVLTRDWLVVQSQAEQGLITFLPTQITIPGPVPQIQTINDTSIISLKYDVKPAGDTDVLYREEKLQRRFLLAPFIQPTAAYPQFLMDLISELLPEDATKYNSILQQGLQSMQEQMMGMAMMLREATTDDAGNIMPEWKPFAAQLQQMFSMLDQQQKQQPQQAGPTPNAKPSTNAARAA